MSTSIPQPSSLFSAPYRVISHLHVDDEYAEVVVRCIGYPTHGIKPVEWSFALRVPKADLAQWPLGASVRLGVTA